MNNVVLPGHTRLLTPSVAEKLMSKFEAEVERVAGLRLDDLLAAQQKENARFAETLGQTPEEVAAITRKLDSVLRNALLGKLAALEIRATVADFPTARAAYTLTA